MLRPSMVLGHGCVCDVCLIKDSVHGGESLTMVFAAPAVLLLAASSLHVPTWTTWLQPHLFILDRHPYPHTMGAFGPLPMIFKWVL